jgi:hypothetical protein
MIRIPIHEYCVAAKDTYIPVPCRGIVVALKGCFSETVAANDTVNVLQGANSVNLITVGSANVAEGVLLTGTPDATNKELIFDPDRFLCPPLKPIQRHSTATFCMTILRL